MFLPTSSFLSQFYQALSRRKRQEDDGGETKLARVLSLFDLTALGVGSTLGLGVYVLAGAVANELAGPSVVISFLIAAIASAASGLCYAEFAARVPKAGSAYIYSYVSIGEFVAFTIGWNLILEHGIGTASVARGMSGYLDSLFDKQMSKTLRELLPMNVAFLAEYPDFFTLIVVILLSVLLAIGVKESTIVNNIFTAVNVSTILIIIFAGFTKANMDNWNIDPKTQADCQTFNCGSGGFMPFGIAGIIAGAAKCFYGFVGFDIVATTGEEAKNPKRNIPLSIFLSLIIIFLGYFGISTVLTMMVPYYELDLNAPFPYVFDKVDYVEVKWVVTIGANFALSTALLGAMFPLPRILYSMASDGIIYKLLQDVSPRTKTPVKATMISGTLSAILGAIFNLHQLIDMMSIGTLLAYTIVAICVLMLRYQDENMCEESIDHNSNLVSRTFNTKGVRNPNPSTSSISKNCIIVFSLLSIVFCALTTFADIIGSFIAQFVFAIIVVAMIACMLAIGRQPVSQTEITFKVPLVPTLPCLSVLINLYLMFQLDIYTWIRFLVWLLIGYVIYFSYGVKNSVEGNLLNDGERNKDMTQAGKTDCTNNQISGTYNITLKE